MLTSWYLAVHRTLDPDPVATTGAPRRSRSRTRPRSSVHDDIEIAIIQFRYRRDRQLNLGEHMARFMEVLPLKPLLRVPDCCSRSGHRSIHDSILV